MMSLFDPPKNRNLGEDFPEGKPFWLLWAEYSGLLDTAYGKRPAASVLVKAIGSDEEHSYTVFGTLAEQINGMEDGEIPAVVTLAKEGRRTVWQVAAEQPQLGSDDSPPF